MNAARDRRDELRETLLADGWREVVSSARVGGARIFTHPHKPGSITVPDPTDPSVSPLSVRAEASILRQAGFGVQRRER
jgi:predicted RNA binding protein YcfA (HicA-like mRNA interferase family)